LRWPRKPNPNPGEVNETVVLTATVTPSSATGSIAFAEAGTPIVGCTAVALTGNDTKRAACTLAKSAVTLGSHAYTAAYSGDATVTGSNGALTLTVGKRSTMLSVATSHEERVANASFQLSITVADPLATGTVGVTEAGLTICAPKVLAASSPKTITCIVPGTTAGNHVYIVSYSGDGSINLVSKSVTVSVDKTSEDEGKSVGDDDDGLNVGGLVTALRPVCKPLTASTANALIGETITLTANCTFRGKLARSFAFYRTGPGNTVTYLGDSTPAGSVIYSTTVPTTPGVYTYSFVALNGNIASALIPGVAVTVTIAPPSSCAMTGPATLAASAAGSFAVTCTGGSPITGYSWSRTPALAAGAVTNAATLTDTPFVGANVNIQSATYSLVVSNSAGSATVTKVLTNSSYNAAPTVSLVVPASAVAVNYGLGFSGIAATANDVDQGVAKVVISDNGVVIATCTYSPPVPNKVQDCKTIPAGTAPGAVTAPIALPLTAAVGPHVITAVATDALGVNSTVATQTITVNPVAPSSCSIIGPSSLSSNSAGTFAVSCTAGSPIASYVWTRTPALAAATTTPGLTDTPFTGANFNIASASYRVTVTNSVGSSTATLLVTVTL
jgi:large repetitive protein